MNDTPVSNQFVDELRVIIPPAYSVPSSPFLALTRENQFIAVFLRAKAKQVFCHPLKLFEIVCGQRAVDGFATSPWVIDYDRGFVVAIEFTSRVPQRRVAKHQHSLS